MHYGLVSRRKDTIRYRTGYSCTVPIHHALWHDTQYERKKDTITYWILLYLHIMDCGLLQYSGGRIPSDDQILDTPVTYLHIMHCGLVSWRKNTIRYWILLHLHSFVCFAPCQPGCSILLRECLMSEQKI
jgi:hypothetical protein